MKSKIFCLLAVQIMIIYSNCQQCPAGFYKDANGICYKFFPSVLISWANANVQCLNETPASTLPVFRSQTEFTAFTTVQMNDSVDIKYWIGLYVSQDCPAVSRTDFNWINDPNNVYGISNAGKWAANRPDPGGLGRCVYTKSQAWTDTKCFAPTYAYTVCQCRNCLVTTTTTKFQNMEIKPSSTSTSTTKFSSYFTSATTNPSTTATTTRFQNTEKKPSSTTPSTTLSKVFTKEDFSSSSKPISPLTTISKLSSPTSKTPIVIKSSHASSKTSLPLTNTVKTTATNSPQSLSYCTMYSWSQWSSCSATCENVPATQCFSGNSFSHCSSYVQNNNSYSKCKGRKYVMYQDPLTQNERLAVIVTEAVGCTALIALISITILQFLIFRIFNLERMLHMCQEISLICAHIIINCMMKTKIPVEYTGTIFGIFLQYFYLVNFTFLTLESLQTYCILQRVLHSGGFFGWKTNLIIGWGIPVPIVALTANAYLDQYTSEYSCWLNITNDISNWTLLPLIVCFCLICIMTEAAAIGDTKRWPLTDHDKYTAAMISQKGIVVIVAFNYLSWSFGTFAWYWQKVSLFCLLMPFNVCLGVSIFIFHTFSNEHVGKFVKSKFCSKKGTK